MATAYDTWKQTDYDGEAESNRLEARESAISRRFAEVLNNDDDLWRTWMREDDAALVDAPSLRRAQGTDEYADRCVAFVDALLQNQNDRLWLECAAEIDTQTYPGRSAIDLLSLALPYVSSSVRNDLMRVRDRIDALCEAAESAYYELPHGCIKRAALAKAVKAVRS